MKKIDKIFALMLLVAFAMVGCSEGDIDNNLGITPSLGTGDRATITLRSGGGLPATRVAYNYDDDDIVLSWELHDKVTLFNESDGFETDFQLQNNSAGENEGKFVAVNEKYILEKGTYKIFYPTMIQVPTAVHVIKESDQLKSGDASHLKNNMILESGEVVVDGTGAINATLIPQQCVIAVSLINVLDGVVPTCVTYECGGEAVTVNLKSYDDSGKAIFLIPANLNSQGDEAKIVVYYTNNNVAESKEIITTLSQDQKRSKIYSYAVNMDPNAPFEIKPDGIGAESGSMTIDIPVTDIVEDAGNASDFTVSIINAGNTITGYSVTSVQKGLGGSMLTLTLSGRIYTDDDVKVSYSGTSVTSKDGKELSAFQNVTLIPSAKSLIYDEYLDIYNFESSANTSQSNHKAFALSWDDKSSGEGSLRYIGGSEATKSMALAYYIGSVSYPTLSLTEGNEYVAVLDVKLNKAKNDETLNIRVKTASQTLHPIDFSSASIGEWSKIEVPVDVSNSYSAEYRDGETINTFLGLAYTNYTLIAYNDDFYIDNLRVYLKDEYKRPSISNDVGVGDLTEEEF